MPQVPHSSIRSLRVADGAGPSAMGGISALSGMLRLNSLELQDCDLPAGGSCPPSLKSLVRSGAVEPFSSCC